MLQWYVLHSKPRKESVLWEQLQICGIEAYLPAVRVETINPRARKEQPFFPSYLFIHVDLEQINISDLQWMPGTHGIVCFGGEPASVPDRLISSIQMQIDKVSAKKDEMFIGLKSGDLVMITNGPFTGCNAIFDARLSGQDRVRVLLQMLQGQQIRLELPGEFIYSN